jgi:hypothetical protein
MTKVLGYASKEDLYTIELLRKDAGGIDALKNVDTSKGWKVVLDDHSRTRHMEDRDVIVVRVDKVLDFRKFGFNIPPAFVIFTNNNGTLNYNGWADKNDPTSKIIEDWEFKQSLSPNTIKTFSELIDEL